MSDAKAKLAAIYRSYLACLNAQDWPRLGQFVHENAVHNRKPMGVAGYRAMLEKDFEEIPDLQFNAEMLLCDPPIIGCRLVFDCTPTGIFCGLMVDSRRVKFSEHVFYKFENDRIIEVWSVIDKAAIEAQL